MTNLIYQCWHGDIPRGAMVSRTLMQNYAKRIGAEYRCDVAEKKATADAYFAMLRPVTDPSFDVYDKIAVLDMDIYPVDGLTRDVFDEDCGDFAMAQEPHQPEFRSWPVVPFITSSQDDDWASRFDVDFPRDENGRLIVFNSGVVLFSKSGRRRLRQQMWPIPTFQKLTMGLHPFYRWDQHYMHAMAFVLPGIDFRELSVEWNRQVHGLLCDDIYDKRTEHTKFVHVQLRGANGWDFQQLSDVVNAEVPCTRPA